MPGRRVSGASAERRTVEALTLLQQGRSASVVTSELARTWGVSERQAARYVAAARRRVSWALVGDSLAPTLYQALSTLQELAAAATAAGDLREANKAWATFATLIKSAGRIDPYAVWETQREPLGAVDPAPFPDSSPSEDPPPF